ncbi:MAG: hypothetical protein IPK19_11350 [Chloroflexi bacterium]|nr:hypothetical protein [Chloroflexota bacterium]
MKRRSKIFSFFMLLSLLFLVTTGALYAQDAAPRVLRIASLTEPPGLVGYVDVRGAAIYFNEIYNLPPWGLDDLANPIPILVEEIPSIENGGVVNADGKTTVSFTIADWAVWSDGEPITAADFILPFDMMNDGISIMIANRFANGAAVESVAQGETEKDVVVTFAAPQPDITNTWVMPLPDHALRPLYETALAEGKGFDTLTDWIRAPQVGNNAFVFAEWVSGSFLRFTRNENYWKDVYFDELNIAFYPDPTVLAQTLATGGADMATGLPLIESMDFVAMTPTMEVLTNFTGTRIELQLNLGETGHPALKDPRVRQALVMAIDRQSLSDDLFNGLTHAPRSYWDGTPWFNPDTPFIDYDPEGALALMREAGWYDDDGDGILEAHGVDGIEDGTPLQFRSNTYSDAWSGPYRNTQLALQDMLTEFGIDVEISEQPFGTLQASFTDGGILPTGQFDIHVAGWGVGVSKIAQPNQWACEEIPSEAVPAGINFNGVCYPEMDAQWAKLSTELDPAARQEAANWIQNFMAEENFMVFLVGMPDAIVKSTALENVRFGQGNTRFFAVNEWSISS